MKSIRLATVALLFLSFGVTGFGLPAVSRTQPLPAEQHTADQEKLFPIVEDNKLGYINASGEIVIPLKFKQEASHSPNLRDSFIHNRFSEGRAAVETEDGWGFIDTSGEFVVKPRFEQVQPFSEGLAAVQVDDRWGFIDRSGKLVVDFKFERVGNFHNGISWFLDSESEKYGSIDRNGHIIISPSFDDPVIFQNGLGETGIKGENGRKRFIDQRGEFLLVEFDSLRPADWVGDQLVASRGDEYFLIGEDGGIAWGPGTLRELRAKRHALQPPGTLLPVLVGEKYGFENADQKLVIPARFDSVSSFSEGLVAVRVGLECGYIDSTGAFVIKPRFQGAYPFVDGRAFVQLDEKWGLIDRAGNFVVQPCFRKGPNFRPDVYLSKQPQPDLPLALVEFDDENDDTRIGYVNRAGKVVWSTKY
jgi:hypothetical protein